MNGVTAAFTEFPEAEKSNPEDDGKEPNKKRQIFIESLEVFPIEHLEFKRNCHAYKEKQAKKNTV